MFNMCNRPIQFGAFTRLRNTRRRGISYLAVSSVTKLIPDESIVSPQTCTLPDFAERLIVQAELVGVS